MFSISIRRVAAAAVVLCAVGLPGLAQAQNALPKMRELVRVSPSGNYLAARHAGVQRDAAAAAAYYRAALRSDPNNPELLERAFLAVLSAGDLDEAVRLANRLIKIDNKHRVARLVLGVRGAKQRHYRTARTNFRQSVRGPITDLAATLLTAWAQFGSKDTPGAITTIDRLNGPDWYTIFKDLHAGMILDAAGRKKDAGERLARTYKLDPSALRVVQAYASWLSRNGKTDEAVKVLENFDKALPNHPLIVEALATLKTGKALPLLIDSPQEGAAEVLYGLGAALGRRGGQDLGLVYLQLALYLTPSHPLALLSLADLYEAMKKPEAAIEIYERLPAKSSLSRNAQIQMAVNLDSLNKTADAKAKLNKLIAENPKDMEAIMALGNIQRARKDFADCAATYSKGIDTIAKPEKSNWLIFYFRGICYERSKQWPKAEADLKKALELYPDEPHVLNYLGYSWIDQGLHLDQGMRMIKQAVQQRPDDGYIVDSLGWAHYRLGNYDEAVKQLERAVELKPEDPTINDHLGDAYWKVGRKLEAQFQWAHARDLKPEPEDLVKIQAKLKNGLASDASTAAEAETKKKDIPPGKDGKDGKTGKTGKDG